MLQLVLVVNTKQVESKGIKNTSRQGRHWRRGLRTKDSPWRPALGRKAWNTLPSVQQTVSHSTIPSSGFAFTVTHRPVLR